MVIQADMPLIVILLVSQKASSRVAPAEFRLMPCQSQPLRHIAPIYASLFAFSCRDPLAVMPPGGTTVSGHTGLTQPRQSGQRGRDKSFRSSNLYKVIMDILSPPYLDFLTPPPPQSPPRLDRCNLIFRWQRPWKSLGHSASPSFPPLFTLML